jgi:hypothetical protein
MAKLQKAKSSQLVRIHNGTVIDGDAAEIGDLYRKAKNSLIESMRYATDCGHRLIAKKKSLKHGTWLPWLEDNADVLGLDTPRTAQRLMDVATKYDVNVVFDEKKALNVSRQIWGNDGPARVAWGGNWNNDQRERKRLAEEGFCVVANMRDDGALIAWAATADKFVRVDRNTDWGNPFEMPADGERAEVIEKFQRHYLPHKRGLLGRIEDLRGKVLGCWCHPEDCHGHVIQEIANKED